MNFYDYSDENSKGLIENAIFNKCQVEIKKLNEKIENVEKTNQDLILKIQALEEIIKIKYIKYKTSEGTINWFRVTKIETGSLTGEGFTHYIRNIYVEDVGFSQGQFICKDENGLFQIWDNIEYKYVDYLSYDKESDEDTIEFNFLIRQGSNTNECYKAPNIKSFLERLASARNYDIIYLN